MQINTAWRPLGCRKSERRECCRGAAPPRVIPASTVLLSACVRTSKSPAGFCSRHRTPRLLVALIEPVASDDYRVVNLKQIVLLSVTCATLGAVLSGGTQHAYALSCADPRWSFELVEAEADGIAVEPEVFWNDEVRVDGSARTAVVADRLPVDLGGVE